MTRCSSLIGGEQTCASSTSRERREEEFARDTFARSPRRRRAADCSAGPLSLGYADGRRIGSAKGALLVHNSWGERWGEAGYGWLPYDYVNKRLAADFWTVLHPRWLESSEFERPR